MAEQQQIEQQQEDQQQKDDYQQKNHGNTEILQEQPQSQISQKQDFQQLQDKPKNQSDQPQLIELDQQPQTQNYQPSLIDLDEPQQFQQRQNNEKQEQDQLIDLIDLGNQPQNSQITNQSDPYQTAESENPQNSHQPENKSLQLPQASSTQPQPNQTQTNQQQKQQIIQPAPFQVQTTAPQSQRPLVDQLMQRVMQQLQQLQKDLQQELKAKQKEKDDQTQNNPLKKNDNKESPQTQPPQKPSFFQSLFSKFGNKVSPAIYPPNFPPPAIPHKKTLIFDLDETLIHSSDFPPHSLVEAFNSGDPPFYVFKRPGLDNFLSKYSKIFDLFIFTYGEKNYANPIIDVILPSLDEQHRLFRDSCTIENDEVHKDINEFKRPLSDVILIEDNFGLKHFHPNNTIIIPKWAGVPYDKALVNWLPGILDECAKAKDVRKIITNIKYDKFMCVKTK